MPADWTGASSQRRCSETPSSQSQLHGVPVGVGHRPSGRKACVSARQVENGAFAPPGRASAPPLIENSLTGVGACLTADQPFLDRFEGLHFAPGPMRAASGSAQDAEGGIFTRSENLVERSLPVAGQVQRDVLVADGT